MWMSQQMRSLRRLAGAVPILGLSLVLGWTFQARAHEPHVVGTIGDLPVLPGHVSQDAISDGSLGLQEIFNAGAVLFETRFNALDGAGRPTATGSGTPTVRSEREFPQNFNRSSGPDTNSCVGCHNKPRRAGGGDNVANAFVLAELTEFTTSIGPSTADERNPLGLFGSGAIEMLAREMTADLHRLRDEALAEASGTGQPVTRALVTKTVDFGAITAFPDGSVDTGQVEGVDADLIIRPFGLKGVHVSLRVFSNNAMNHHHGMQSSERFGDGIDFDGDGIIDELSRGDITAVTIFQAAQAIPGQKIPARPRVARAILRGEDLFQAIGCASCHVPAMILDTPIFSEPGPFNPPGNLTPGEVPAPFTFDLTREGPLPRLEPISGGKAIVRAFTDLKRHHIGAALAEQLPQRGVPGDMFLTKKLWGFASEPHFLHHGRATLIGEAILLHGGEAQAARDAFAALSSDEQADIIEFLRSLVVLPEPTSARVVDERNRPIDKAALRGRPGF